VETLKVGVTTVQSLSRVLIFMSKRCKIKLTPTSWARAGDWTDASLATPLPPTIQLFHKSILPHLIQLLHAPKGIQSKIAKYSRIGRTLENATVFSDWGSDGSIMPHLLNNVRPAEANHHGRSHIKQKIAAAPKLESPQPFPLPQHLPSCLSNRREPSKHESHCQ
jgi:hypothetical protein